MWPMESPRCRSAFERKPWRVSSVGLGEVLSSPARRPDMRLPDREQQELDEIERHLAEDDPKLAASSTAPHPGCRAGPSRFAVQRRPAARRQPARRHRPRLPRHPHHLRRSHRLGSPHRAGRLTSRDVSGAEASQGTKGLELSCSAPAPAW
ncbi:DUF3040 domain-containing protein [Lentzea sp. NPDC054927]